MTRRLSRFGLVVAVVAALSTGAASRAFASDDDPRKVQAEPAFNEGQRLYQKGHYQEALVKLREAYATYPSPNTLSLVALAEQQVGQKLEAVRHFREALKNPVIHPNNAKLAREKIAQLEQRLGRVRVDGPRGLSVTIDGLTRTLPLTEPVDVVPGTVSAEGALGGAKYQGRAVALAGQVVVLHMAKETGAKTAPPVGVPEEPPPVVTEHGFWDAGRIAGIAAFAVGGAAVVAGIAFGASSNDAADHAAELQASVGASGCTSSPPAAACGDLNDARDAQDRDATLSTVFLVGGAVVAAAGVGLFVWPRHHVQVQPAAGRNGAGVWLTGSF